MVVITERTIRNFAIGATAVGFVLAVTVSALRADGVTVTEDRLLADAADGSLDDFSLLQGALIASGVNEPAQIAQYCSEFSKRAEALKMSGKAESAPLPRAELIYDFLHTEFLTGEYSSTCTELPRALDGGDYNCVTATILYHCLCQLHSLSPVAVATNTHVRSRLMYEEPFDIETTCREWFDVVRRDPLSQKLRTKLQDTRQLSDVQLLAKIYYNRGVSLLEQQSFAAAMTLLRISQSLDADDAATRENLAAGWNNWALAECDAGQFDRAVELLLEGQKQYSEYEPFAANDVHIHQQWAVALCNARHFAEAMQVLHAAHRRRPDVALFDRGRLAVLGQWAAWLLASGDLAAASQLFDRADGWFDDSSEIARCRTVAVQTVAEKLTSAGRHDDASRVVSWGLAPNPSDPRL